MTGYKSKRAAAQDKLEQWDMPSEAFNAWWDSDYDDSANPYEKDTFAYWAWAGWQAALAQPAQEPVCPACKAGVLYECVACSSNNYPPQGVQEPWRESASDYERGVIDGRQMQAQSSVDKAVNAMTQRTWVGLTDAEVMEMMGYEKQYGHIPQYARNFVEAISAKLKEKNNG